MLELSEDLRFYFYNGKTNMRGGCRRLCETIRSEMKGDPANGNNVYVFMNRRCTIVRILHYGRGFMSFMKSALCRGVSGALCSIPIPKDTKSATRISYASQKGRSVLFLKICFTAK